MRIAIVGAGFSGLLLAVHLLRRHPGIRVTLVEQAPSFGRGLAYGAADPDHVLNVRASNMSAFPDDPSHFLRWLCATAPAQAEAGFVSRRTFGGYLQALLRAAVDEAGGRLDPVADEAVALAFVEGRPRLRLAIGRSIDVDRVSSRPATCHRTIHAAWPPRWQPRAATRATPGRQLPAPVSIPPATFC